MEDFDLFWSAYPKKVGKADARKAFAKAKASVETMIASLDKQKQSDQWTREGGRYIPNPATWLNQGRWEDELRPAKGDGYQKHGQELSPQMAEWLRRSMEGMDE